MSSSKIPLPILIVCAMLGLLVSLLADESYHANIDRNKLTGITTIRIIIPKTSHSEPIESIKLLRKNAEGFDLIVPIQATENPKDYSIFMMLPNSVAEAATIRISHIRPGPPNEDGTFTSPPFVPFRGESYDISLAPNDHAKSEKPAPSNGDKPSN